MFQILTYVAFSKARFRLGSLVFRNIWRTRAWCFGMCDDIADV